MQITCTSLLWKRHAPKGDLNPCQTKLCEDHTDLRSCSRIFAPTPNPKCGLKENCHKFVPHARTLDDDSCPPPKKLRHIFHIPPNDDSLSAAPLLSHCSLLEFVPLGECIAFAIFSVCWIEAHAPNEHRHLLCTPRSADAATSRGASKTE